MMVVVGERNNVELTSKVFATKVSLHAARPHAVRRKNAMPTGEGFDESCHNHL